MIVISVIAIFCILIAAKIAFPPSKREQRRNRQQMDYMTDPVEKEDLPEADDEEIFWELDDIEQLNDDDEDEDDDDD